MCGYCLDGPPNWVDIDMYINTGQVDTIKDAALNLHSSYWASACQESKNNLGVLYRAHGLNWREGGL